MRYLLVGGAHSWSGFEVFTKCDYTTWMGWSLYHLKTNKQADRLSCGGQLILWCMSCTHKHTVFHQPGNRWSAHGERVKANIAIILLMSSGLWCYVIQPRRAVTYSIPGLSEVRSYFIYFFYLLWNIKLPGCWPPLVCLSVRNRSHHMA